MSSSVSLNRRASSLFDTSSFRVRVSCITLPTNFVELGHGIPAFCGSRRLGTRAIANGYRRPSPRANSGHARHPRRRKSPGNLKLRYKRQRGAHGNVGSNDALRPNAPSIAAVQSNQRKTMMMNTVLALTLSAAILVSLPVYGLEQQKDRCSLKEDSAEKIADCDKLINKKSASPLDESTRKNKGLIPDR
jgi:hypothetical protein